VLSSEKIQNVDLNVEKDCKQKMSCQNRTPGTLKK
jgi:hypothetical protein